MFHMLQQCRKYDRNADEDIPKFPFTTNGKKYKRIKVI